MADKKIPVGFTILSAEETYKKGDLYIAENGVDSNPKYWSIITSNKDCATVGFHKGIVFIRSENKPLKGLSTEEKIERIRQMARNFVKKNLTKYSDDDLKRFEDSFVEDAKQDGSLERMGVMPQNRAEYVAFQAESGLKVGDKVKIIRTAESGEGGWANSWAEQMDAFVGQEAIIARMTHYDIILESRRHGNFAFPFFVLEKA